MKPTIDFTSELPPADKFYDLFLSTGWNDEYKLKKDELYSAMNASWFSISAYDGDRLIGFGRIVSDGVLHAMIYEMIVDPDYQQKRIGEEILAGLLIKCFEHKIRDIQLFCAKEKKAFYEKYGFVVRPEDAPGMEYKRK